MAESEPGESLLLNENQELRKGIRSLYAEVACRIGHGANSNGHLEYVRKELEEILDKASEYHGLRG